MAIDTGLLGRPQSIQGYLLSGILAFVLLLTLSVIYNLFLHPLRRFPGPKWAAASQIPYLRAVVAGNQSHYCMKLHEQYGDVVRVSPSELSYTSVEAWKDIYGHHSIQKLLPKDPEFYSHPPNGVPSIITVPHPQHPRIRRQLSHAFSEKALRAQQPLMTVFIDLLINRLREKAEIGEPTDMVNWFNWITFDLVGDLSFGESFGCLEEAKYHPWVDLIFKSSTLHALLAVAKAFPGGLFFLNFLLPRGAKEARLSHQKLVEEKVLRRLDKKTDRPDFMYHLLRNRETGDEALTTAELTSTFFALVAAGAETTGTSLAGTIYLLLRNPDKLKILKEEIRSTFDSDEDISMENVAKLPYLGAVQEESLRIYPPVPIGPPRRVPQGGAMIAGQHIPSGTAVSVNQLACYRSPRHFRDADSFIPERFLGDPRFVDDNTKILQPFSMGTRSCLGRNLATAEIRVIIAKICWNFDLELADDTNWLDQRMFIFWQKLPLNVKLTPRPM